MSLTVRVKVACLVYYGLPSPRGAVGVRALGALGPTQVCVLGVHWEVARQLVCACPVGHLGDHLLANLVGICAQRVWARHHFPIALP